MIEKELFDKISNNNEIILRRVQRTISFLKNNNVLPIVTSTIGSTVAIVGCCTNVPSIISSQVFANELAFQSFLNSGIKLFNGVVKTNISQITMWTTKATQLASKISTASTIFGFATLGISEIIGFVQKINE